MSASTAASELAPAPRVTRHPSRVVVIAASTGGPNALARVLPALPASLGAAVLVAQHMPPGFTGSLARRLDALSALPVREAVQGDVLEPDHVYLAPGGLHILVDLADGVPCVRLDPREPLWGVRPAADLLFESAARAFGECTVGVVLTGMGRDGAAGLRAVRRAGGAALVQDRDSSVVFGMPQAALDAAGADRVVPLAELGQAVADAVRHLPPNVPAV
ncbi:CheB methylesterase domain-containing protein [Gemmatirosa kalamazoonensis]|uniref:CheB methylesterase domain-containing protein n=1 Tax=Gemmatirosa kalamazoonensis TaxID=861299 RepID=UPI000CE2DCCF|nr:CheB methylesterase domain-containing protein [Gemmatirosa kalamazoonensis]